LAAKKWLKIQLAADENWRLRNVKKIDASSFLGCCQMDVKPFPPYQDEISFSLFSKMLKSKAIKTKEMNISLKRSSE